MILHIGFILIATFFIIRYFLLKDIKIKKIDFKKWWVRLKAIRYKKRKIKQSKLDFESDYYIKFKVFLRDKNGNHTFENDHFEIEIPANAAYFARKKLETHIKESITIDIIDIKEKT